MPEASIRGQLLLLSSTLEAVAPYAEAARKMGVEYLLGIEADGADHPEISKAAGEPRSSLRKERDIVSKPGAPILWLRFAQRESALEIVQYAMEHPLAAVVAADEACAPSCARAASMMGHRSNPPKAADTCLDKFALRQRLSNAGLRTPLLGEAPANDRTGNLALAAILDNGKMRVLGTVEDGQENNAELPKAALEAGWRATRAVSLSYGPVYAQLRMKGKECWVLDLAPAIPMRLADALRFRIPLVDEDVSLAEVILRHALGIDITRVYRK